MNNRKKIIIGNWKMNNGPAEAHHFLHALEHEMHGKKVDVDWAIAAPFVSLPFMLPHSHHDGHDMFIVHLAAQNFHQKANGAYTGEISLPMLEQLGVRYAIVGHSERRQYFNETNKTVNEKLIAALATTITPVFAFGETLSEFEAHHTIQVIEKQLHEGLANISKEDISKIVFAYEPIWAIGTGKTATPEQAQSTIKATRDLLVKWYGNEVASKVRIQYGGSVNPANIATLMAQPDIDGALVGGASVKAEDFAKLVLYKK